MPFERFMRQRAPRTPDPAVTIQKRGTLSLNAAAYIALGSPEAIELLYDREQRLIALCGIEASSESAYPLRPMGTGSTWLASGKAFMNYYGIEVGTAQRYNGRMEDDLLIVDLKEPGTDVSIDRDRKPQPTSERSPDEAGSARTDLDRTGALPHSSGLGSLSPPRASGGDPHGP
jgi:hypothetical protein